MKICMVKCSTFMSFEVNVHFFVQFSIQFSDYGATTAAKVIILICISGYYLLGW